MKAAVAILLASAVCLLELSGNSRNYMTSTRRNGWTTRSARTSWISCRSATSSRPEHSWRTNALMEDHVNKRIIFASFQKCQIFLNFPMHDLFAASLS
ncbi:hypothetical protein C0J52_00640 [Blattella germanica]|nr:hypothetical protein C0J52_00640 [Blattella germanica]